MNTTQPSMNGLRIKPILHLPGIINDTNMYGEDLLLLHRVKHAAQTYTTEERASTLRAGRDPNQLRYRHEVPQNQLRNGRDVSRPALLSVLSLGGVEVPMAFFWTTEIIDVKQWGRDLRARDLGSLYMDEAHVQRTDVRIGMAFVNCGHGIVRTTYDMNVIT